MSTDIRAAQKAVEAFMAAGCQTTNIIPKVPDDPVADRRILMLREELEELIRAWVNGDIVEYADAIADIIYVALGAAVEAGIDIEPVIEEVIDSNNSKIDWQNARPWVRHDNGKIGKDEHYRAPLIGRILEAQGHIPGGVLES